MIVSWKYSQKIEILEYDLCHEQVVFKCLCNGANEWNLEEGETYTVDFSCEEKIPDIARIIKLIETQYSIYLCD